MIFRQIFDVTTSSYTYLIGCEDSKEAVIIDPVNTMVDAYTSLLCDLRLNLVSVIDTHVHADHITGSCLLKIKTKCNYIMGYESKARCVDKKIQHDDIIHIGDLNIQALYTPGHTDDSYSFLMNDRVFTGDTLLIRGTGRTDFQNGNSYDQYDSIFNKLFKLGEDVFVYPAHDYKGFTKSTIGEEIKNNPRLQVKTAAEYASIMNNLKLAKPKNIDIAVPANLNCALNTM